MHPNKNRIKYYVKRAEDMQNNTHMHVAKQLNQKHSVKQWTQWLAYQVIARILLYGLHDMGIALILFQILL